jgi:FtsP/CotA-like multicopper oxidase with cupredoxin domain
MSALAAAGLLAERGINPSIALASTTHEPNPASGPALAVPLASGLSDPAQQPKFANPVPDALAPGFKFTSKRNRFKVAMGPAIQQTGLVDANGNPLSTPVWGYGLPSIGYTWPGRTFEVQSGSPVRVKWENKLLDPVTGAFLAHLLPVDTNLHWAYSLHGYQGYTIANAGVPAVAHLHGGHTDFQFDGNPEFFFSPGWGVRGPQWRDKVYVYDNDQPAGSLWYHDHALGITRLNVYAGLAGFYFVRDAFDTGKPDNPLGLPAWPYEKAYAIQDRMFLANGELFYPAFPGDPAYADFITGEGVTLTPPEFPDNPNNVAGFNGGGPTALAEFFGDHIVVNGAIWPKEDVEPRHYRLHLLNGTDSRFMMLRFRVAASPTATDLTGAGPELPFWVIGSDQGLAESATSTTMLLSEPGSRYDIVFDFDSVPFGSRVIMENIAGDAPFGGDYGAALAPEDLFPNRQTDRIMAFDVVLQPDLNVDDNFDPTKIANADIPIAPVEGERIRKVALFEGKDEFGRLQPLLGTAEPATDYQKSPIEWPQTPEYAFAGLTGQMEGSIAWHSPTTENPALGATEVWEIWNMTGDAHPVHLHLVHFDVLDRTEIVFDSHADEDGFIPTGVTPADDGVYLVKQPTVQHNSVAGDPNTYGIGFRIVHPTNAPDAYGADVPTPAGYVENAPKDMVTALPGQITRIRATFDKPGRYVWHCHILSHEDHEMMRVLHVDAGA